MTGLPVELPGMVRASFGLATSRADIDRLVAVLHAIVCGEVRAIYVMNEHGDIEPEHSDHAFIAHGESLL